MQMNQVSYTTAPPTQVYPNASYVNLKPSPSVNAPTPSDALSSPLQPKAPNLFVDPSIQQSSTSQNNNTSSTPTNNSNDSTTTATNSSTTNTSTKNTTNTTSTDNTNSSTGNAASGSTSGSGPSAAGASGASSSSNQTGAMNAPSSSSQAYTPFGFVPTMASTVPVHDGKTRSKGNRRQRTGSKRSIEELIMESTIPTATTMEPHSAMPQRQGPQIALLSMPLPMNGMISPSMIPSTAPTLPLSIPEPPLATATPANPNVMKSDAQPRPKKKSKYTAEQDAIILRMKKDGRSWTDICEAAKCGNSIAARNRYQVLIGQQGGGAVVWEAEDTASLKKLLEEGEKAKWNYIANELSRIRNKKATAGACQKKIKDLFDHNPAFFGIILNPPAPAMHPHPHPYGPYMGGAHVGPPGGPIQGGPMPGQHHPLVMPQGDFHDMLQGAGAPFMGAPAMLPDFTNMRK